jgi:transposase
MDNGMSSSIEQVIGLDLGDRWSQLCVLTRASAEIIEQGRVQTTAPALHKRFGARAPMRIALEVGTHSPWVSRLLQELGHEVIVANPRNVRLISESSRKDDRVDAETLARLARVDPKLLSPVRHRGLAAQTDLAVLRAWAWPDFVDGLVMLPELPAPSRTRPD